MADGPAGPALGVGLHAVPPGHVAAVVTFLETTEPPGRPVPETGATVAPWSPTPDDYRSLYRAVGADWLWSSRLAWPDPPLSDLIADPRYETFRLTRDGRALGMLDLDARDPERCDIAYFGLVPDATGGGLGRQLMDFALRRALGHAPRCVVNTCTLDSPAALPFYIRSGFRPVRRAVEIMEDPRGTLLPQDAAPQVPRV